MSSARKRIVGWFVAVLCTAIVAVIIVPQLIVRQPERAAGPAGLSGQTVPLFSVHDDAGTAVSLAQYRGDVVVVNLWASWCPPCRAEMPELQRFADAYRNQGVVVVAINQGESAVAARAFARSLQIRFPVWLDEQQQYGRALGALGLPTTIVIDRDGIVRRGFDGAVNVDQVRTAVAAIHAGTASR